MSLNKIFLNTKIVALFFNRKAICQHCHNTAFKVSGLEKLF